jgi:hypothetical protein
MDSAALAAALENEKLVLAPADPDDDLTGSVRLRTMSGRFRAAGSGPAEPPGDWCSLALFFLDARLRLLESCMDCRELFCLWCATTVSERVTTVARVSGLAGAKPSLEECRRRPDTDDLSRAVSLGCFPCPALAALACALTLFLLLFLLSPTFSPLPAASDALQEELAEAPYFIRSSTGSPVDQKSATRARSAKARPRNRSLPPRALGLSPRSLLLTN